MPNKILLRLGDKIISRLHKAFTTVTRPAKWARTLGTDAGLAKTFVGLSGEGDEREKVTP
jgi:hypothetical protein